MQNNNYFVFIGHKDCLEFKDLEIGKVYKIDNHGWTSDSKVFGPIYDSYTGVKYFDCVLKRIFTEYILEENDEIIRFQENGDPYKATVGKLLEKSHIVLYAYIPIRKYKGWEHGKITITSSLNIRKGEFIMTFKIGDACGSTGNHETDYEIVGFTDKEVLIKSIYYFENGVWEKRSSEKIWTISKEDIVLSRRLFPSVKSIRGVGDPILPQITIEQMAKAEEELLKDTTFYGSPSPETIAAYRRFVSGDNHEKA